MSVPQNPKIDDLYWDSPTATMRVWDGKHWKESTSAEVAEAVKRQAQQKRGNCKWY